MQGIVRKLVAHHPHRHTNSHRIFHTRLHSTFSSVTKPSQSQLKQGNHIPSSFLTYPLRHFLSFHHFAFNSLLSLSARTLLRCRPNVHYFRGHNSNFNHNYAFYRRSLRSWFPGLTSNDMVLGLIITNVVVFLLWGMADEKFMIKNFTISLDNFNSGRLHTLITNAFSHRDTWHIFSNMIGLYFFGKNIGRNFGPEFLLKLYLAGAVGGSVFYLNHQAYKAQTSKDWNVIAAKELALGASGAVEAVMLFHIFTFPKATIYYQLLIPTPAVLLGIYMIARDILRIIEGNSQISGSAHLGGAAVAAIAWAGVRKGRF